MQKFLTNFLVLGCGLLLAANQAVAFGPDDVGLIQISPTALGPGWKMIQNVYSDADTTTRYEKKTTLTPNKNPASTTLQVKGVIPSIPGANSIPGVNGLSGAISAAVNDKQPAAPAGLNIRSSKPQAPAGPQLLRAESVTTSLIPKPEQIETDVLIKQMGKSFTEDFQHKGCESGPPLPVPQASDMFRVWVQIFQCQKTKNVGLQFYIDADPASIYLVTYSDTSYPFTIESRDAAEALIKGAVSVCYKDGKDCYPLK